MEVVVYIVCTDSLDLSHWYFFYNLLHAVYVYKKSAVASVIETGETLVANFVEISYIVDGNATGCQCVAGVVDNNEEMEVRNICVNLKKIQPDENKKKPQTEQKQIKKKCSLKNLVTQLAFKFSLLSILLFYTVLRWYVYISYNL